MLKQCLWLLLISSFLGLGINLWSPNKIDYIGTYRDISPGDGPIVPPAAAAGDPPFIDINTAQFEHAGGRAVFIDAREPADFECGTIPGSINVPFDNLPYDDDLSPYFDSVLSGTPGDTRLVVFCSGEECDLSLHLARNLQEFGYSEATIFFGGSREWENSGLEIERRKVCD